MPVSTATVQRCKTAFFNGVNAGCDPDLSWWDWANMPGNITPWACEDARTKYFACVASGIPPAPAPAPPSSLPTDTAGNEGARDLTQEADDATRARQSGWVEILSSYFGEQKPAGNDEPNPLGLPFSPSYLLYGALAVGAVLLLQRGRR